MTEKGPRLNTSGLDEFFLNSGAEGLRSAVATGRASFGDTTWDAVAIDGGINAAGELDDEKRQLYQRIEAKLEARLGEPIFVVGAHHTKDRKDDYVSALGVAVGIVNPDSTAVLKRSTHFNGVEIDTIKHVTFWQFDVSRENVKHVGVQGLRVREAGIPTKSSDDYNVATDIEKEDRTIKTHVFATENLGKWVEEVYGNSDMGYLTLATSVEALYKIGDETTVRGLFASNTAFRERASRELAMLKDAAELFRSYMEGFKSGRQELADSEKVAVHGALRALVDKRLADLREKHADLIWRLPGYDTGRSFGDIGSRSVEQRLAGLEPQLETMTALLS